MSVSKTTRAKRRPHSRNAEREHNRSFDYGETVSHTASVFPTHDATYKHISQYCAFVLCHELHVNCEFKININWFRIDKAIEIANASILCNLNIYLNSNETYSKMR